LQEILGAQARALSIEHREKVGDAKLIAQSRQASSFLAGLGRSAEQITADLLTLEIDQGVFGFSRASNTRCSYCARAASVRHRPP